MSDLTLALFSIGIVFALLIVQIIYSDRSVRELRDDIAELKRGLEREARARNMDFVDIDDKLQDTLRFVDNLKKLGVRDP